MQSAVMRGWMNWWHKKVWTIHVAVLGQAILDCVQTIREQIEPIYFPILRGEMEPQTAKCGNTCEHSTWSESELLPKKTSTWPGSIY